MDGWVGGWVGCGWVEEKQAVGMRCCKLRVGWVGGWKEEEEGPLDLPNHPLSRCVNQLDL